MDQKKQKHLSDAQIKQFVDDGVLVVTDFLSPGEVSHSLEALDETLRQHGVDSFSVDDAVSAQAFSKLSSTNGSGGVLDLFYDKWKMEIATDPKLFAMTQDLWFAAYCSNGEPKESLTAEEAFRWHPFGVFDCDKGYVYIDRIGYRLPSEQAQSLGELIYPSRKKKSRALQRSLTPHLDCCPDSMYTDCAKWRPIQCFVSLSDCSEPNTGGFEAARGFHREFDAWTKRRAPTIIKQKGTDGTIREVGLRAPCVGEYTHIRPKEDRDVMDRVMHIPIRAGSAVFWDNRIPHANAYKHVGDQPRAVVYCSFLPDIELNRIYVQNQLADFRQGKPPRDQWNHIDDDGDCDKTSSDSYMEFTSLGRRLMGIEEW